jgi:NADP-dependent 3-hydroxy acid dehydrogenase YdfG
MTDALHTATALVTGASSGIGAATALTLAAAGARVALVARRKDRLDEVVEQIHARGGTAIAVPADLTDADQAAAAVRQTVDAFGGLDLLVNNAGVMLLGPIEGAPLDEWDRMLAINVSALLYVTHAALPHLLASAAGPRGCADVITVSSVAGRTARVGMGVYNLTKHGVGAFSESLRQEVASRHVRVTLVEPGPVATELFTHIRPEILEAAAQVSGSAPALLAAEDVAETVLFAATRPARVVVNEILVRPADSIM